jgi:hypothetical protein
MMKKLFFLFLLFLTLTVFSQEVTVEVKDPRFTPITEKVSVIGLRNSDTVIYRTVNIAIGEVLVVEFPQNVTLLETPTIGDAGLLRIEADTDPLRLRVWGLMFPDTPESSMYGLNSNIQFKINSGQTFIFNLILQPATNASNRIIFSYPEWEEAQKDVNRMIEEHRRNLEAEHEKKMKSIEKDSERLMINFMARSFSEFFQCNNYAARTQEDLIFLRSDRICKIGRDGIVTMNFSIKNRYRQRFHIEAVKVYSMKGGKVEIEGAEFHLDKYSMQFDEIVNGAIAFRIKDEDYSTEYIIEVIESAGKKRKLELKVSF